MSTSPFVWGDAVGLGFTFTTDALEWAFVDALGTAAAVDTTAVDIALAVLVSGFAVTGGAASAPAKRSVGFTSLGVGV